jgi:hypothetical protein
MAKGDHRFLKHAKGSTRGDYVRPRVAIGFDPEVLKAVRELAKENDRSFGAEIRALVDKALKAKR